ncbi:protein translocase subunit SecD [Stieleria varia]|uniref:Multifunctional fusion protein n=1 Tax=Stieleria varia TaxID=2528005 RepID=A0A5C5ZL64_9BACT|nr:protein translocase subunit SecD [Stieleria varia]TWT87930.1 bifunctional preprotein translocase subunit SecD/SecF [Stieleria varia]
MDCSIISQTLTNHVFAAATLFAQTDTETTGISWTQYGVLLIAIAVMVVPFVLGAYLAKQLKMPGHSSRIGWVLFAIIASAAVLINKLPGLGVDLRGGTILVYEIDPEKNRNEDGGIKIKSEELVGPLIRRVNPAGTREIVIRPYGETQIEVIVPEVDQREVDQIKTSIAEAGLLRFAIVANQIDHKYVIDEARQQSESPSTTVRLADEIKDVDGSVIGRWAIVDRETGKTEGEKTPFRLDVSSAILRNPDTGEFIELPPSVRGVKNGEKLQAQWVDQSGMSGLEILMVTDPLYDVTGEDLAFASSSFDESGGPSVAFTLTDTGSGKFYALTSENSPQNGRERQLGIVLDDRLLSAPNIQSTIQKQGRITGRFTQEEVDQLVNILKAGQLPAALTKQPIAENEVDATLGTDTINKGIMAISVSLGLVLLFILFYYRFAGAIACLALVLNLAMILATMVFINQPMTLPGLAGLVLTVGMSVDANVLIFERIREELNKGAKPRMAIRNGFAKATVTIIDANLTTLLTAIVLYAIGTDQIRGFAVTLILGILFSMFTAIYMSRTLFDIAERHNKLTLSMSDGVNKLRSALSGEGNVDFIGKGALALTLSGILVLVGIGSLFARGKSILDIDFAGGSSVQFRLSQPLEADEVRSIMDAGIGEFNGSKVQFTVNGVTMEGADKKTVYKVDSSLEDVNDLKDRVVESFAAKEGVDLLSYQVSIQDSAPAAADQSSLFGNGQFLTVARPQDAEPGAADAETTPAETTPAETAPAENAAPAAETAAPAAETAPAPADASASTDDAAPADSAEVVDTDTADAPLETTTKRVMLSVQGSDGAAQMSGPTLILRLKEVADELGIPLNERVVSVLPSGEGAEDWSPGSSVPFAEWKVELPMSAETGDKLMAGFEKSLASEPIWVSSSSVGSRVAGQMVGRAGAALFASLIAIIGYIWFRFQRVIYGFAAVAALVHDVLITLGAIAVSFWLADFLGFMLIDQFKISLTVVAALLTIIGYSLNDTIVVFDRIREVKGKAPRLTGEMVNTSINQTLSRTLLTSLTTLIVVVLLYAFGGDGIHAFAFALVVGVIVGTYSSIFVASPILLWLVGRGEKATA